MLESPAWVALKHISPTGRKDLNAYTNYTPKPFQPAQGQNLGTT